LKKRKLFLVNDDSINCGCLMFAHYQFNPVI